MILSAIADRIYGKEVNIGRLSFSTTMANRTKVRDAKLQGLKSKPVRAMRWQPVTERKVFYFSKTACSAGKLEKTKQMLRR